MIQSKQTFNFKPSIRIEGSWMIGSTDFQVYNPIFNITEDINKFELYKFLDEKGGGVPYTKLRDEIEKDLDISNNTATNLQDDLLGPNIFKENREQVTQGVKDDKYMLIIAMYVDSIFQDFESFLRTENYLVEDDVTLILDEYNSSFITYELEPGIYTFEDISKALFHILQLKDPSSNSEIAIELDDFTRKTKLVVKSGIIAARFKEKSFFNTILGFTLSWV